jgi:hypothetical protein
MRSASPPSPPSAPVLALALALAACGSASRPPARPIAQVAPASAPAGCLPSKFRDAALDRGFTVQDGRARLCFELGHELGHEATDHACLLFDRDGQIVGEPPWKEPKPYEPEEEEEKEHKLTATAGAYTVCTRRTKSCTSFRVSHPLSQAMPMHSAVSDDGALAFVLHDGPPSPHSQFQNEIVGELYDTRGGRLLGSVKLTSILGMYGFSDPGMTHADRILGPRAVIVGAYPAGPGGTTALVDPGTGKGIPLHGFGGDHLVLDGRTMLVLDEQEPGALGRGSLELSLIDMTTLTTLKKAPLAGRTFEDPERSAMSMTKLGNGVLVAYARPASIAVFDLATRTLSTPRPLPLCPD